MISFFETKFKISSHLKSKITINGKNNATFTKNLPDIFTKTK
ncbi:hypothetical protein L965_1223 [Leuconostoc pseudomesenteroides PS12]|nr:hypothetical protein L964_825 [Leuconostoc pseudomesenteroides 1159]KDA49419.1 hypothetical protein L965_1223 [Leuconostoc pseudomesenteroides PS12]CCJ66260.1 hypothetical protein Q5C_09895 [Leuconostoc pseudomesenteroides 4882]